MRKVVAAIGLAILVLGVVPARSSGQSGDAAGYDYYSAAGLADGLTARLFIDDFLPVEEFSLSSVSAESRYETGQITGLAVLPDPGDVVLALPGTLAGLAGLPGLPDYPAAARADHPSIPRKEVSLVPDAGLGALRLLAEADEAHSLGRAFVTNLVDTVGVIPGFSVGSIRSESTSRRLDGLTYEVRATTTTNDVKMLGGLFRIGQLTTAVTARIEDGRVTASAEETRVSGAEVAGQPVGIDGGGFTAPNGSQALQPVIDQLTAPLAQAGYSVTVTPGSTAREEGRASADSGTLRIEYRTTVQGYPATLTLGLGRSTASVGAGRTVTEDNAAAFDDGGAGDLAPGGTDFAAGDVAGVLGSSLEAPADVSGGSVATTTGASSVAPASAVDDLMDFRGLYKLLMLGAALLVAVRFWTVARAKRSAVVARPDLRTKWRW